MKKTKRTKTQRTEGIQQNRKCEGRCDTRGLENNNKKQEELFIYQLMIGITAIVMMTMIKIIMTVMKLMIVMIIAIVIILMIIQMMIIIIM